MSVSARSPRPPANGTGLGLSSRNQASGVWRCDHFGGRLDPLGEVAAQIWFYMKMGRNSAAGGPETEQRRAQRPHEVGQGRGQCYAHLPVVGAGRSKTGGRMMGPPGV